MKLAHSRYMRALTRAAVHIQGPAGQLSGEANMWPRRFLHAPSLGIAGGSDQVQANIIGERALGLPPEPREDRDAPFRRH
jgi:alkylation response protein AidB-like acyl-CoA dehydrogenase